MMSAFTEGRRDRLMATIRSLRAASIRSLIVAIRSPDSSDESKRLLRRAHPISASYGRRIMKTYTLPAAVESSIVGMTLDTPERAVVVTNAGGQAIGVFVAPDEYNVLRSTYDLVKDPDGIAKISGSYEPKTAGITFEQMFAEK